MYSYMENCPSDSVEQIILCHSLEHLIYLAVPSFLQHCYRSMVLGGTIKITCPDSLWAMKEYLDETLSFDEVQLWLHAHQLNEYDVHRWLTDEYSLTSVITTAGFKDLSIYKQGGSISVTCRKELLCLIRKNIVQGVRLINVVLD